MNMTSEILTAIAGAASAVVAVFAAIAAWRSARAAEQIAGREAAIARRGVIKDLIVLAHSVVVEENRVAELAQDLEKEYDDLSTFTGQFGGSRHKLFVSETKKKEAEAGTLKQDAERYIAKASSLSSTSDDDLANTLIKLNGHLVHVQGIRANLERKMEAVAQENRLYREKRIQ
jgi:hypothetical protein